MPELPYMDIQGHTWISMDGTPRKVGCDINILKTQTPLYQNSSCEEEYSTTIDHSFDNQPIPLVSILPVSSAEDPELQFHIEECRF